MIELDGNYGEGGGSIVRVALALSVLTGKGFKVADIRAGRKKGGLKAQHLTAIKAWKKICSAEASEVKLRSTKLWFKPGKIRKGNFEIDIGTAGSITLLLQAFLLPCMMGKGKISLRVKGGTCGKGQASVEYLRNVLLLHLERFVSEISITVLKRGYYPKGGGEVMVEIVPRKSLEGVEKIELVERGELKRIEGIVDCAKFLEKAEVGGRIKTSAQKELGKLGVPIKIKVEYAESLSPGGEAVLWGVFANSVLGGDALAERGKRSEEVGQEAAKELISEIESEGCVDKHLGDQLLPFMALLPGSEVQVSSVTEHAKTNIYVIEKFLPVKFKVDGKVISVSKK